MSNNFCRHLSNGYFFSVTQNNSLSVAPCCWFVNSKSDQDSVKKDNRWFNSIDNWTPHCKRCHELETSGQQSMRQASFDWIPELSHNDPISVEIFLDNTCNAACTICNEASSSLWHAQNQKFKNLPIVVNTNKNTIDHHIDEIFKTYPMENLKYLKIFGGEPLMTDTHIKFLSRLPNPKNVTLHYTTNGSIFPNKATLDIWDKFHTVIFAASIDGINEQFDYVRWPLKWSKVSKNLIKLKNKNIHNLLFRIEFTINWLNAYYYDQVEDWVEQNLSANLSGDKTEINLHPCVGVWDINRMPVSLRNIIKNKYPEQSKLHNFVKNLAEPLPLDLWYKFVTKWDQQRNTRWDRSFLELENLVRKELLP
jgi:uncharacterized Fe-S cluster-containing radical SAM superfamily protein